LAEQVGVIITDALLGSHLVQASQSGLGRFSLGQARCRRSLSVPANPSRCPARPR
jgi:hypothetical protein